ncbi:MAG: hypothetical protein U0002_05840 [Thermoanaerobaculia bacterium]
MRQPASSGLLGIAFLVALLYAAVMAPPAAGGEPPPARVPGLGPEPERGLDPWNDPVARNLDPKFWHWVFERMHPLAECYEAKHEPRTEARTPEDALAAAFGQLGLAPDASPEQVLASPLFLPKLRSFQRQLIYECGKPLSPEGMALFGACADACTVGHKACFAHCQNGAPPAPTCVEGCDLRREVCEWACFIGVY